VPISARLLYTSILTYPIYSNTEINSKTYEIFLNHFTDNPSRAISVFNLKSSKKLAVYLLSQSYRNDIPKSQAEKLRSASYHIIYTLQEHYPFDAYLMLSKAEILIQQKQFVQAYGSVLASYTISQCYAPIMQYRLALKQNYNMFVADKIKGDMMNLQNKNCDN
jgi:hypothetical protein